MKILTSDDDNFIYDYLINLLGEVKLVQGGAAIPPTLRRHKVIRNYLIEKQRVRLDHIEEKYFDGDNLNGLAIEDYLNRSLHNIQSNVN